VPELGNTNFEPVPFGGGSNEPPKNDNLNLAEPVYSPIMMALSKANLDPEKVRRIKQELNFIESSETHGFSEPMNIDDSSRFGGGGFIDSMTTNLERNMACVLNSMVMANVRVHCKELQQHPKWQGKSCELITLLLTEEMYELYKEKDPSFQPSQPEYNPFNPISPLAEGISPMDAMRWAWVVKRALMKKYGVSIGKKRLSGYTPAPEGDPPTPFPKPQELWILPEHVIAYGMGPGRDDDGGPFRPVEASSGPTPMSAPNPANASSCCPPEGCVVILGVAFREFSFGGNYRYTHHQVMGVITKCEPLTIECFESPMQMPGGSYTFTVNHYRGDPQQGMMGDFGFTNEYTEATISNISGGTQETRDAISRYSSVVIKSIVCFCD
tara:strand:- start:460 stop:1608 length:1149 start_codon:yes stop_codon:yes gene_type:complete